MLDVDKIIEIFLEYDSLSEDSKSRLIKLKQDLNYCSPELLLDKFFNGNRKGTLGLCGILSTYEKNNDEILDLYKNFMNYYKEFNEFYVNYEIILESKPFFNDKYLYYFQSKKIQKWWKEILYNPINGILYDKYRKKFLTLIKELNN